MQTASRFTTKEDEEKGKSAAVQSAEDEQEEESDYHPDTSMSIAKDIYQEHGVKGFWRGYESACILVSWP
jgi:hypothetical protein